MNKKIKYTSLSIMALILSSSINASTKNYIFSQKVNEGIVFKQQNVVRSSCLEYYNAGERVDGNYTIDIDGNGPIQPFSVYCLMSEGGWTKIGDRVSKTATSSSSYTVLIENLIPNIPDYNEVMQPDFIIYDCASCSGNGWTIRNENSEIINSGSSHRMNGTPFAVVFSSSNNIIYQAIWNGMSNSSGQNGVGGVGPVYIR